MTHALAQTLVPVASLLETVQIFEQLLPVAGTYDVPAEVAKTLFGGLKAGLRVGADLRKWPDDPEDANRWATLHSHRCHYYRDRDGDLATATLRLTPQDTAPMAGFSLDREPEFCRIRQCEGLWPVEVAGYAAYLKAGPEVLAAMVDFRSRLPARA